MSSSAGGKFQDHYAILEVEASSDAETILAAYNRLAAIYHPSRGSTPDADKFKALSIANEILSDPSSREAFDQVRGNPQQEGPHRFSGATFFRTIAGEPTRRLAILCLLYDRAREKPTRPGLSVRQTEAILNMSGDDMRFAVAYLKQRGLAVSDDKSNLLITVDGMDYVERSNPDPALLLPLLTDKLASVEDVAAEAAPKTPTSLPTQPQFVAEPVPPAPEFPVTPVIAPAFAEPTGGAARTEPTQSENLAARIRSRMAIPRPPAVAG